MRITTQMLNETASKSGLPIGNASLLNSIADEDEANNSLLEVLNKKSDKQTTFDSQANISYKKLQKAADQLEDYAEILLQGDEKSIFYQAEERGDYQNVYDNILGFLEYYNSTLEALAGSSSVMNQGYRQMLTQTSETIQESLAEIGITLEEDGTAVVDMEKLKEADGKKLEELFGSESEFVSKVKVLAGRISENAEANSNSFSSTYASNGSLYTANIESKYDIWG